MAMEQDSRRNIDERSYAAIALSGAAVRAEEPVMGEGHRNGQGIACRLHREPRTFFAAPATHVLRRSFMGRIQ